MESCFKEAFQMPFTTISNKILCKEIFPLFPHASLTELASSVVPASISYYTENQIVLLLNETSTTGDSSENACLMIVEANNLPFVSIGRSSTLNSWKLHDLKDSLVYLQLENEKVRSIPHSIVAPLAVSASRGVACIFAARKRALVYILEEDEDEISETNFGGRETNQVAV